MKISNLIDRTKLKLAHLRAVVSDASQTEFSYSSSSDIVALEERIMLSATPMAVVTDAQAVEPVDCPENVDAPAAESQDSAAQEVTSIVFVDSSVEDYQQLVDDIGQSGGTQVVLIDSQSDGVDQITDYLSRHSGIESIHIVAHGTDGEVRLGNTVLNANTLDRYSGQIASWGSSLTSSADILFYGCDFAATEDGRLVIEALSELTGADINASDDLTGHADLGGDWDLEYVVGHIETDAIFSVTVQENWLGTLEAVTVTTLDDVVDGDTTNIASLIADSGDDGFISLREAILAANGDVDSDTITLGSGVHMLEITDDLNTSSDFDFSGDLDIYSNITIQGVSAQESIISTVLTDRLFQINSGDLVLQGLTLDGGNTVTGAAVFASSSGSLQATDTVFRNNSTNSNGGAIFASGDVTLNRVALIDNQANFDGGAIRVIGGTTSLTNVTVSGNTAGASGGSGDGGGIVVNSGGSLIVNHSTFADNEARSGSGGGLQVDSGGTVTISNSIFANNRSASGGNDVDGDIVNGGFNIIEDRSGFITSSAGPVFGADPELSTELELIDGTFVHTFDTTSIAYNAATGSAETQDQRGSTRDSSPDIGAYELQSEVATASQVVPEPQTIDEDSTLTFLAGTATEVSVSDSLSDTNTPMRVTLSVNDGVLTLSQLDNLTIVEGANGSSSLVIDGTESDLNAALDGLEFTPDADFNGSVTLNVETAIADSVVNLEGFYTFEGGNADDRSAGTSYDGTLEGDASIVSDAERGQVLLLDGVGDGDSVKITGRFGEPTNVTLAAFVNLASTDISGASVISVARSPALYFEADGTLVGYFQSGGIDNFVESTEKFIGSGWIHVAVSIDADNSTMTLFVDGQAIETTSTTGAISYDNTKDTLIGGSPESTRFDFGGKIDDARVYSRALSSDEIVALAAGANTANSSVAITVDPVNDAPELVGPNPALGTITEDDINNQGQTVSFLLNEGVAESRFSDAEDAPEGIAVIVNSNDFNGRWQYQRAGESTWTDVGVVSNNAALLLEAADKIRFLPDGENGDNANLGFRAWDGTEGTAGSKYDIIANGGTGGSNGFSTNTVSAQVSVTSVNDAPVLDNIETGALTYNENAGAVAITSTLILEDVDNINLESAVVAITAGFESAIDTLSFTDTANISGFWNLTTGELTLTATMPATVAEFQAALRSVTYTNSSDNPTSTARTVSFTVNDGGIDSNTETRDIAIVEVNDDPTATGVPTDVTVTEDVASDVDLSSINLSDVDANSGELTVTLTAGAGDLTAAVGTGITVGGSGTSVVTLSGTLANLNDYLNDSTKVQYLNDTQNTFGNDADTINVTVNDSGNTGTGGGTDQDLGDRQRRHHRGQRLATGGQQQRHNRSRRADR